MKSLFRLFLMVVVLISFANCGSNTPTGTPVAVFSGPELDISEALQLEINHFYVKELTGVGKTAFFSVYIQDSISEDYLVCAGPDEGLNVAIEPGVYYGKLSVPLREVVGAVDHNSPQFNIIIVADQEDPCPGEPDPDKIIASSSVGYSNMIDTPIEFGDEDAFVTFKGVGHDDVEIETMPSVEDSLTIGEIYFETPPPSTDVQSYYIAIYFPNDLQAFLAINPMDMPSIRSEKIIYSWLDLTFDGIDSDMLPKKAYITLYRMDEKPVEIGSTEELYLEDLYGHKFEFTNNSGYIKFRSLLQ